MSAQPTDVTGSDVTGTEVIGTGPAEAGAPVDYTEDELLASHDYAEPLVANGVRCHGGFDDEGRYVSPRTRFRVPATAAWEARRRAQFGTEPLSAPIDTWPAHYPNVAQAKHLLRLGVTEPVSSILTRIGTVEGFGGMLRLFPLPDFRTVADDIPGTATDHLGRGLFEAHARDEAGHDAEAGHDRMWFAARDIAFENPPSEDMRAVMLERMGITSSGSPPDFAKLREMFMANRALPSDVDPDVEILLGRMIGLLFIEISAFHSFAWAEEVLSDTDLVAGDGEAARLVSYIRADETPHVAYLQVVLSELRDRTWTGATGARYDGAEMIDIMWQRALDESRFLRRGDFLKLVTREVERSVADRPDADDVIEQFFALGTVRPLPGGGFVERLHNGDEIEIPAA